MRGQRNDRAGCSKVCADVLMVENLKFSSRKVGICFDRVTNISWHGGDNLWVI